MPSVVLVTERFVGLAEAVKVGHGSPRDRSLQIPGNPEFITDADIVAIAERMVDQLVALMAPEVARRQTTAA